MGTSRLVALSDGVFAIIITIMVLELRVPQEPTIGALKPLVPVLISYMASFGYLATYWNNHHHFMYVTSRVNGAILWANLHLLFWLSLIPFVTRWIGENHRAAVPTAAYGFVLLMSAMAWYLMQILIVRNEGDESTLRRALGADLKGKLSLVIYLSGIGLAFVEPWAADALYVLVTLMWLVPDRRIERIVAAIEMAE